MTSRNRLFAKLGKDIDTDGNITSDGLAAGVAGAVTIYSARANLPASGNTAGDQAYVTANNRLYIWNGSGWYNVALLNIAPGISSVTDSDGGTTPFTLATDGTATTITITAVDSDGDPITFAASADSAFNGLGTISQSSNVFTITPKSQDSATTSSGTITFTATDGVNTASSGVQTFSLTYLVPQWKNIPLSVATSSTNSLTNSTFVDRSSNSTTVTTSGTPIQSAFNPYLDNWSFEIQNTGNSVLTDDVESFGTSDFTAEGWVYLKSHQTYNGLFGSRDTVSSTSGFVVTVASNGDVDLYSGSFIISGTQSLSLNTWHHVAYTRSSGTHQLWVDGVSAGTTSTVRNYTDESATSIGGDAGNVKLDGYISNVRFVKGTAIYTSAFTPPTEKLTAVTGTKLLTAQSNRFIDNSSTGAVFTLANSPKVSSFNPFGQSSEYDVGENKGSFYGENAGYLTVNGSSIDFTSSWTIEFWVYYDASDVGAGIVSAINAGSGVDGIYMLNASDFYITVNGSSWGMSFQADSHLTRYSWHHIAVTWDSSTYTVWIDGVSRSTLSSTSAVSFSSQTIGVGATSSGTSQFGGYISDYNITTGSAKYTSAFTPPTSPVGNTNADLYLPMDNAGIFDKAGNNRFTLYGKNTSTTQTKYGATSVSFISDSAGMQIEYQPWMNSINGDFTWEAWVYLTSGDGGTLWSFGYDTDNRFDFGWQGTGGIRLLIKSGGTGSSIFSSSDAVSSYQNTWAHIALVRSGDTYTLYMNGTSSTSGTSSLTIPMDTVDGWQFGGREFNADYGGGTLSDAFDGYMDNIQFVSEAKYTSNFTAPTQTQGRVYQVTS